MTSLCLPRNQIVAKLRTHKGIIPPLPLYSDSPRVGARMAFLRVKVIKHSPVSFACILSKIWVYSLVEHLFCS